MRKILLFVVSVLLVSNVEAQVNEITINQKRPNTIDTSVLHPYITFGNLLNVENMKNEYYTALLNIGSVGYSSETFTFEDEYSGVDVFYTHNTWYFSIYKTKKISIIFSNNIKLNIISGSHEYLGDDNYFEIPSEYLYLFKDYTIKSFIRDVERKGVIEKIKVNKINSYFNELFKLDNLGVYMQQVDSINVTNPYYTRYKFIHGQFVDTFTKYEDIEKNNNDRDEYSRKHKDDSEEENETEKL